MSKPNEETKKNNSKNINGENKNPANPSLQEEWLRKVEEGMFE